MPAALDALRRHQGVAGRMQRVEGGQPFAVVVDFAHTPDALTQALSALRSQTPGRLIAVFGSAGERDRAKRPWMGRVAARLADYFVLTDEDPRLESREAILEEIAAGAREAGAAEGERFVRVPDRGQAVYAALARGPAGGHRAAGRERPRALDHRGRGRPPAHLPLGRAGGGPGRPAPAGLWLRLPAALSRRPRRPAPRRLRPGPPPGLADGGRRGCAPPGSRRSRTARRSAP